MEEGWQEAVTPNSYVPLDERNHWQKDCMALS
jgi:hypothetical protein